MATDLTGRGLFRFIKDSIDPEGSELITDEYNAYNAVNSFIDHKVIAHAHEYVNNGVHTNTIEGVWSLLKRAWYGSHHHYTKQITPLFVAETTYKYNARKVEQAWGPLH